MSYRKLEIWGQSWSYKVGQTFVDIRDPKGRGYRPTIAEVQCGVISLATTLDSDDPRLTEVRPAQVREYIMGEIGLSLSPPKKTKKGKK